MYVVCVSVNWHCFASFHSSSVCEMLTEHYIAKKEEQKSIEYPPVFYQRPFYYLVMPNSHRDDDDHNYDGVAYRMVVIVVWLQNRSRKLRLKESVLPFHLLVVQDSI